MYSCVQLSLLVHSRPLAEWYNSVSALRSVGHKFVSPRRSKPEEEQRLSGAGLDLDFWHGLIYDNQQKSKDGYEGRNYVCQAGTFNHFTYKSLLPIKLTLAPSRFPSSEGIVPPRSLYERLRACNVPIESNSMTVNNE